MTSAHMGWEWGVTLAHMGWEWGVTLVHMGGGRVISTHEVGVGSSAHMRWGWGHQHT